MAAHDDEDQPQAADLGEFVQEDPAETLIGPPGSDPLDAGYIPPDRPYALDEDHDEDLDARLRRERPDTPDAADPDRSGRLASTAVAPDGEYTRSLEGEEVGVDGGAASAEEAAVHVRDGSDVGVTG